MKLYPTVSKKPLSKWMFVSCFLAVAMFGCFVSSTAQTPELSLADLLIGLRSQKVSLPERNKILAEAVLERGVTFAMTPEIETELTATGAANELIKAIKEKAPAPVPPAPQIDHTFFQRRAIESSAKGEYTLALADFNTAVEMKSDDPALLLGRGRAYLNLKSYERSIADFDRALELSPSDSNAYYNRGVANERMDKIDLALSDYKKAVELDDKNESAKQSLKRLEDSIAKVLAEKMEADRLEAEKLKAEEERKRKEEEEKNAAPPEYLNLGTISNDMARRLVMPTYPPSARQAKVEGRVSVMVEIDLEGNVTSAEATTGHKLLREAAESAAKRSKFTPLKFNEHSVKGRGIIVYNFSLASSE
ncbi:MAG: TonB family protein [Acidobacteria bacterium]|nr:TonB family protein [Acidobacteriota bacterium]